MAATQSATITVQSVNPPGPGKQKSKIVDAAGDFYYAYPDKAANFVPGMTYDVNFTESTFNGFKIRNIESGRRSQAAPQQPRAAAVGATGGNTYRETSAADKLSMFVTAIVKAGIQSGQVQFNDEAIAMAIQQAAAGYREGWTGARQQTQQAAPQPAPQPRQTAHPDMDDQIPF